MAATSPPNLSIIGVCRFSYLGFSDWRSTGRDRKERTKEEVIDDVRKTLFVPKRVEQRFATFECLTLPSLAAQTDKNFRFIVLTSDELPEVYANRLRGLAKQYPFIDLIFAPVGVASAKFSEVYADLGYDIREILQFRLDDDDAVGRHYIRRMRELGNGMHALDAGRAFAITFPTVLMVAQLEGKLVFRRRHFPHTAAGQAMYHPTRNVMNWAHHTVDRSLLSVSEWYNQWVLQTFLTGVNDSGAVSERVLLGRNAQEIDLERVEQVIARQFPFASAGEDFWSKMMGRDDQSDGDPAPEQLSRSRA